MPFNNYVNLGSNSSRTWNLRNAGTKEKHSVFVWLEISMKRSLVWYFTATNRLPRKSYTIPVFIESMIKCLKKKFKSFSLRKLFWNNVISLLGLSFYDLKFWWFRPQNMKYLYCYLVLQSWWDSEGIDKLIWPQDMKASVLQYKGRTC